MPQDHLTAKREYLENELRKRPFASITEISLKKSPGTHGYGEHQQVGGGENARA